ncbi:tetratricopeptide repeat protein [Albidovulum sediminis]|uniref:Tetratricopeptide repeat protein n=1 Tax=Albidovulum sediminis TaxID=3066345 RepID=A0ABT2NTV5_9RHOB|nr:tetratricopeptide repeat protein [Defluviimonas sediminis]MCT8330935.1 tetratricopeptide repeat protein [Defluviimonas sediminis]
MSDPLTRLAIVYGTDKFGYHDYTPNYHKLFAHLRDSPVRMMEIGVGGYGDSDRGGQSLEVWRDYFPQGEITGIDIQKKVMDLGPRVRILQGSQVDEAFLRTVEAERGPFDIILDDGSHRNEHVVESFRILFPTLKAGGIYAVEDVQTSFFPRFGGSITLDAPNSVGLFARLMRSLDGDHPEVADIVAIERFHNIVVAHKRSAGGQEPDMFASPIFEAVAGPSAKVLVVGDTGFDAGCLPFATGSVAHVATLTAGAPALDGFDVVILSVSGDGAEAVAAIETALAGMRDDSVLAVRCTGGLSGFGAEGAVMDYAARRFVEVDHREIAVNFPTYDCAPIAKSIYAIERFRGGLIFRKAANDYPSNVAFDPDHPGAARALALMEAVLDGEAKEGGLVTYADMIIRLRSRESASALIERLTAIGATSRRYFLMAIAQAKGARDHEEALRISEKALEHFPNDPQFVTWLADALVGLHDLDRAERELRSLLEIDPRARTAVAGLTRVLSIKGALEEAATLTRKTMSLFPAAGRVARFRFLASLLRRMNDPEGAEAAMAAALEWEEKAASKAAAAKPA